MSSDSARRDSPLEANTSAEKPVDKLDDGYSDRIELSPAVKELKDYIESHKNLLVHFHQMWDQEKKPSFAGHKTIQGYDHMFEVLDKVIKSAPVWSPEAHRVGSAGLPLCDMFYFAAATPSGNAAFTDPGVAKHLGKVLATWNMFLSTPESGRVLSTWLDRERGGYKVLCEAANHPLKTDYSFEELFECDPDAKNLGYQTWDDFFTRRFRPGIRPIASPDDDDVIINPCESKRYNLAHEVKISDRFWAKGASYSLKDMFDNEAIASTFVGGTIYQSFLSTYSYHHCHAPVSGTVRHAYTLGGTYFAIPEFSHPSSRAHRLTEKIDPEEWQGWLSCVSTRGVVVIEADNPKLGMVGFIAIGIVEVSSIELKAKVGQHVRKGDVLSSFHFGGSTQCLLFEPGVTLEGFPTDCENNTAVNAMVARLCN